MLSPLDRAEAIVKAKEVFEREKRWAECTVRVGDYMVTVSRVPPKTGYMEWPVITGWRRAR